MKIVVVGATGLVGAQLVPLLQRAGHAIVSASRASGIDAVTGRGVAEAVAGADVVVDVLNAPVHDPAAAHDFVVDTTRTLIAAESDAGVRHHVTLSVVGAERAQSDGYFRAKAAQEQLVVRSGVPFTIVRATQFYEFAHQIAAWNTVEDTVRLPARGIRPVASGDVAATVAEVIGLVPANHAIEVAGPEALSLDDFVRRVLRKDHDVRYVLTDPAAEPVGFNLDGELLLPGPAARISPTSLEAWLHRDHVDVRLG